MIPSIFIVAAILQIWFDTEAFIEYARLFKLTEHFFISEYLELKEADPNYTYPDFLVEYHNSFFTRLISCPICTSTWLGIILSTFTGLQWWACISILGLSTYLLLKELINAR